MNKNTLVILLVVVFVVGVAWFKKDAPSGDATDEAAAGIVGTGMPRLVELGAGTCTACKQMKPIIEALHDDFAGKLQVDAIDVNLEKVKAAPFNYTLIPTQVFLDADGKELWRHVGFISREDLLAKWTELGYTFVEADQDVASSDSIVPEAAKFMDNEAEVVINPDELIFTDKVMAYYFHRTARCKTCLAIEQYARQSIEDYYTDQIAAGLLEFQSVNFEAEGNEHFEKDYELTDQSLVLVRVRDGDSADWTNLTKVWEVVGDYVEFAGYVNSEMAKFVREGVDSSTTDASPAQ